MYMTLIYHVYDLGRGGRMERGGRRKRGGSRERGGGRERGGRGGEDVNQTPYVNPLSGNVPSLCYFTPANTRWFFSACCKNVPIEMRSISVLSSLMKSINQECRKIDNWGCPYSFFSCSQTVKTINFKISISKETNWAEHEYMNMNIPQFLIFQHPWSQHCVLWDWIIPIKWVWCICRGFVMQTMWSQYSGWKWSSWY